jgi:release factor glutamine methyltransferase
MTPVTVLEVIQKSGEFLERKGVESPRLQIELLLEHVLKLPRLELYLNFERPVTEQETEVLRECVRRRGLREPLQHILGTTSFCGMEIKVGPEALVPRPETELLAELAWKRLWKRNETLDGVLPAMLEIGVGTGCISLAVAANAPEARLTAVDCSTTALELARENTMFHNLQDRVALIESDGFSGLADGAEFDLIVSNPPYIPSAEIETLAPEVRDHDPRTALDGGEDGMDFFRMLAEHGAIWLRPTGAMMLEFGDGQAAALTEIFANCGWIVDAVERDLSNRERFIIVSPNPA